MFERLRWFLIVSLVISWNENKKARTNTKLGHTKVVTFTMTRQYINKIKSAKINISK